MTGRRQGNRELNMEGNNPELQSIIKTLVYKICSSDDFINQIAESITSAITSQFKDKIEHLENENTILKATINSQEEALKSLTTKYNAMDQSLRNKAIRINGVKETRNENTKKVMITIIKEKIGVDIKEKYIEKCYRLGKPVNNRNRPIVVYFSRLDVKQNVYNNKKKLKGTGIVIREDLCPGKLKIIKMALEKIGDNAELWTIDGRIFVKCRSTNKIMKLNSEEDVFKL